MSEQRFKPPHDSLSIYRGPVMYARMKPVTHRFTYDVFSTLIDLDRVIGKKKHPAPELIRLARNLKVEFGDPVEL